MTRSPEETAVRRLLNGLRKVAVGLRPFNESVWPGVENDLLVAHRSIYRFFAGFVAGRDVLDAGCGTGYGSAVLADAGARSVLGIDLDRLSVAYARRSFRRPNLEFRRADCERLELSPSSVDIVVASNMLEHLRDPPRFLKSLHGLLRSGGEALVAVPPIISDRDLELHGRIGYHRSNLTVSAWFKLFRDAGWQVGVFRHDHPQAGRIDFASPFAATTQDDEFTFSPADLASVEREVPITVIFRLTEPHA